MDTTSEDLGYGYNPPSSKTAGKAVGKILSGLNVQSAPKPQIQPQSHPLPDIPAAQAPAPVPVGTPVMKSFKKGGIVPATGAYRLHKGELVVPKHKVDAMTHDILSGKTKPEGKTKLHLVGKSKGHKPAGAHGRAAVKELGRTKTTGNFKKIEAAKGKGAAIAAFQNAKRAHDAK